MSFHTKCWGFMLIERHNVSFTFCMAKNTKYNLNTLPTLKRA